MKKILLFAAMLFGVGSVSAQVDNTFSFVDAEGNEVKDGSTVTRYAKEVENVPGMPMFNTLEAAFDLSIKNTTNAVASVMAHLVTLEKSNGNVNCCFPTQCVNNVPVDYTTPGCEMQAGEVKFFKTEWFPQKQAYGTADFTLQILVAAKDFSGKYREQAKGPKVNIHCIYADPAGIADMESDKNATVVARYDSKGNKLSAPAKGLNIIKLSNGKTVKTVIK